MQQINQFLNPENNFFYPFNNFPQYESEDKDEQLLLGKKIKNDTDLILWLSGKEINQKKETEKTVPSELNSKLKKKLSSKLIKNAKKCELFYINHFSYKECITSKCQYCLKNFFDHNELLRFANFEDFAYYLKYLFYLSEEVCSYSLINFKNNKKDFDIFFSKFQSKQENWKFDKEKIMCKLCMLKLVNKPNLIENMKNIFLENKCEFGIRDDEELIIELNDDKKNEEKNKETNKKKGNNKKNQKEFNYNINYFYKSNIPNQSNINNSNYLNINNNNIINNNDNNNAEDIIFFKSKFYDLYEKINNSSNSEDINFYYKQLFFINHNIIIEDYLRMKSELENLLLDIRNYFIEKEEKNKNNIFINIQNLLINIFLLLNEILKLMSITNNSLLAYLNEYSKNDINTFQIFVDIINQNRFNILNVAKITSIFSLASKILLNFLISYHQN